MVLQQHNDHPISVVSIFHWNWDEPDETNMFMRQGAYEVMIPVSTETHGGIFVTADRCWAVKNVELNLVHLVIFRDSTVQSK